MPQRRISPVRHQHYGGKHYAIAAHSVLSGRPLVVPAAARTLYTAESTYGDLDGKAVLDLGCGCGMLTAASVMLGARYVHGQGVVDLSFCA